MKIWVDADACPVPVMDIVIRAAIKRGVETVCVANKQLRLMASPHVSQVLVDSGPDAADSYIRDHAAKNDLVVTQDIPLASVLVPAGIVAIDPRGQIFHADNIGERLSVRNLMQELRDGGAITGGPKQFGDRDKRTFAAAFDRELTRLLKVK